MIFMKTLRRQITRYLKKEDPEGFIKNLANESVEDASFLRDLPAFFEAVNLAYADYDDKLRISSRSLEISSKELNGANRNLENLISSMNAMMDGLGQALLFFNREGICSGVFSRICLEFFGGSPEGKNLSALLDLSEREVVDLELWLSALFDADSAMTMADLDGLAPQSYISPCGKNLRLEYKPMLDSRGKLISVLMIATDITSEMAYQSVRLEMEDKAAQVLAIAANRNSFTEFLFEVEHFINNELPNLWEDSSNMLKARLHTYKGLAGSFYLSDLASNLHALEDMIPKKIHFNEEIGRIAGNVKGQLSEAKNIGHELFGEYFLESGKVKVVSIDSLIKLRSMICAGQKEWKVFFEEEFLKISIEEALQPFCSEISRLCGTQNKTLPAINIQGNNNKIDPEYTKHLVDSFIHIARNIVDHGLEYPARRMQEGKDPKGKVSVEGIVKDGKLSIVFSDDGAGIDTEKLMAAYENGRYASETQYTKDTIIDSVFNPSVSTAATTSILSGRGVGLYAVREEARRLGGDAAISSQKGFGTILTVTIPVK